MALLPRGCCNLAARVLHILADRSISGVAAAARRAAVADAHGSELKGDLETWVVPDCVVHGECCCQCSGASGCEALKCSNREGDRDHVHVVPDDGCAGLRGLGQAFVLLSLSRAENGLLELLDVQRMQTQLGFPLLADGRGKSGLARDVILVHVLAVCGSRPKHAQLRPTGDMIG